MAKVENKPPDLEDQFKKAHLKSAYFDIDNYRISVNHELVDGVLSKMIYVNGIQRARWTFDKESEENKRFAVSSFSYISSKKGLEAFLKVDDSCLDSRAFFTIIEWSYIISQWCERDINKSICLIDEEGNTIYKYK